MLCTACQGSGFVGSMEQDTFDDCPACGGSGWVGVPPPEPPAAEVDLWREDEEYGELGGEGG